MTTSRRKAAEGGLREIDIYSPEDLSGIDLDSIKDYLRLLFPTVRVRVFPPITDGLSGSRLDDTASAFASARMKDPTKCVQAFEPMYGEFDYERRALLGKAKVGGVVYDGGLLERVYFDLPRTRQSLQKCSVVLTSRLLSTYSQDDLRHHLRTLVCGFPSIVSLPGIVEAPAKPREYYVMKQHLDAAGAGDLELAELKSAFRGRFVDYDDPSVNEILKGLVLQAVIFHLTLKPFCRNRRCRLFNAHWQEDLIESQIRFGGFCTAHTRLLDRLGRSPELDW